MENISFPNGVALLLVTLKDKWTTPDNYPLSNNHQIRVAPNEVVANSYYIFDETNSVSVDDLFDYLEYVIAYNVEIESKEELLKLKMAELKSLFIHNPLDRLLSLSFVFGGQVDRQTDEVSLRDSVGVFNHNVEQMEVRLPQVDESLARRNHDTPPLITVSNGECKCAEDEFCDKCMERKGL